MLSDKVWSFATSLVKKMKEEITKANFGLLFITVLFVLGYSF